MTIAQGTPSVTLEAVAPTRLGMTPAPSGADLAASVENRSYAAVTDGASVDGAKVSVKSGGQVTWFAVPDGGDAKTMAGLVTPVTSGQVAHGVDAKPATTTLTWSGPSGPARARSWRCPTRWPACPTVSPATWAPSRRSTAR